MNSWTRLFSFNLKKFKTNSFIKKTSTIKRSKTNLIVASTSLLCSSAYIYYVNSKKSNSSFQGLLAKTLQDDSEDYDLYEKSRKCNRLIRRYKVSKK